MSCGLDSENIAKSHQQLQNQENPPLYPIKSKLQVYCSSGCIFKSIWDHWDMNHLFTHRICSVFLQLPFWNYLGIKKLNCKIEDKKRQDFLAHCCGFASHSWNIPFLTAALLAFPSFPQSVQIFCTPLEDRKQNFCLLFESIKESWNQTIIRSSSGQNYPTA